MKYELVPSKYRQDEWCVEAIDFKVEGDIFTTLFAGPDSRERAEEYARWKNSSNARAAALARWKGH